MVTAIHQYVTAAFVLPIKSAQKRSQKTSHAVVFTFRGRIGVYPNDKCNRAIAP
jgi:hypothetical protein